MEKLLADLSTQLKLLNFTKDKSEGIIEKGNVEGVERQLQSLKSIVTRVEDFKLQIEQTKIANGEKLDDVSQWSLTVEAAQTSADENVAGLRKWLKEYKQRESLSEKEGQQALLEQSRKDQLDFERAQLEMRLTYEKKLEKNGSIDDYNAVIQCCEQLAEGIVERAPNSVEGREFYIPHKGVVRETAESTKLRIVYDASARAWDGAPSLNECLNTRPPLQNQLWSVLIQGRFRCSQIPLVEERGD